jgi:predicted dehydrogenase
MGADAVLITASTKSNGVIAQSAQMSRKRGRIILVGVVGLNLQRADFYEKEITFQVSCSYGPGRYDDYYEKKGQDYPIGFVRWTEQRNFQAVLGAMAGGQLDVASLITDRFSLDEAESAYEKISKDSSTLGIILEYPGTVETNHTISISQNRMQPFDKCGAAMIGAGNFAKMTMGPALAKTNARLKFVSVRTNGSAAAHLANKYGFENATTDLEKIWNDPQVNTVFITTRHNSHAALVQRALKAEKHIFVEKPLCLTVDELAEIKNCYEERAKKQYLMVGFNRRFAPLVTKMKELLAGRSQPLSLVYTVNAGFIPPDHWTQDPEVGGGRIIGEACHFIDLTRFLVGHKIENVEARMMGNNLGVPVRDDKMTILLTFSDGSIGTVHYLANGSKRFPKERLEVFSEGRILVLDNFKGLKGYGWKGFRKMKLFRQDKGHQAEVAEFIRRISEGGEAPIPWPELEEVTRATFEAVETARK